MNNSLEIELEQALTELEAPWNEVDRSGTPRINGNYVLKRVGDVVKLHDFAFNSPVIPHNHELYISSTLGPQLVKDKNQIGRILITGHTDNTGTIKRNHTLGENRALAVRTALINAQVPSSILRDTSLGEDKQFVSNNTADNRSLNRRVEIEIVEPRIIGQRFPIIQPEITAMPTLRRGSRGAAVQQLQAQLNVWGMAAPGIGSPRLLIDGIFGPRTEAIVRAFQTRIGLVPDGVVGPLTWRRLLAITTRFRR